MSQEKVDRYKEEKGKRKQIVRKQKIMNVVRKSALCLVAVALLGWLGFSAYGTYESGQPRAAVEVDYSAITGYMSEL